MKKFLLNKAAPVLPALLLVLVLAANACGEPWSFSLFADSRSHYAGLKTVLMQMKSGAPQDPNFPAPRFVAALGDIDPVAGNLAIFKGVMGPEVPFIPVRGNHESPPTCGSSWTKYYRACPTR